MSFFSLRKSDKPPHNERLMLTDMDAPHWWLVRECSKPQGVCPAHSTPASFPWMRRRERGQSYAYKRARTGPTRFGLVKTSASSKNAMKRSPSTSHSCTAVNVIRRTRGVRVRPLVLLLLPGRFHGLSPPRLPTRKWSTARGTFSSKGRWISPSSGPSPSKLAACATHSFPALVGTAC